MTFAQVSDFVTAAQANGWGLTPSLPGVEAETAGQLQHEGFTINFMLASAAVTSARGDKYPKQHWLKAWTPNGWAFEPPTVYSWDEIVSAAEAATSPV